MKTKRFRQIPLNAFKSDKGFIYNYQKLIKDVVIPYQYDILCDKVEGAEKSHAIENFRLAGKVLRGEEINDTFYGMVFQDSDVAKWLEAVAYSLIIFPDKELEKKADDLIKLVAEAQDSDGYLNTYFTIKDKDKRFTNLLEGHELYCSGHMIEAAVSYFKATGKDTLLKVMCKNADHIYDHFITQKNDGIPGHPEIELALLRLYEVTKNERYLELSKYFIDTRGQNPNFFTEEAKKRNWKVWGMIPEDTDYNQSTKPVREQFDAVGHSVRAVYLYTAMAHLCALTNDSELKNACDRLWESITQKRMYVTGSIGSTYMGEAFTVDYNLPNDTVYGETCASIGLIFFAQKMLETEADGKYADIMELSLYNTVLAGMQLDGKRFFYVNPLEVLPGISGEAVTHKHDLPERPEWYACACCPPNVARLLSSVGQYAYNTSDETLLCNLYVSGELKLDNGASITCSTGYPYDFTVNYKVNGEINKKIAIRIPKWSADFSLALNEKPIDAAPVKGYAYIDFKLNDGDVITLTLDDSIQKVFTTTKVADNTGYVAVKRGPLVYCFEGVDNDDDVLSLAIDINAQMSAKDFDKNLLSGIVPLEISGIKYVVSDELYSTSRPKSQPYKLTAVPYYTWGNRGKNQMRVWLPEK